MTDKIIEEVYGKLKRSWWGGTLLFLIGILLLLFAAWTSLPDSTKERILWGSDSSGSAATSTPPENTIPVSSVAVTPTHLGEATSLVDRIDEVPDVATAMLVHRALSETDLAITGATVTDVSPAGVDGYFEVNVPPSTNVYGSASVLINKSVFPHFFITARMAGDSNIGTLELKGLGVYFLLDNSSNSYMIYNSEENQTPWTNIPFSKSPDMNTLGMYQVGKRATVFLNSRAIASFTLWETPSPGQAGIFIKARADTGGRAYFERLAIYQF